jgi:ABC-type polysaccharide/polyol phosphate export systems, permease component
MHCLSKEKIWLIANLALRQFLQRYQGSFFGVLWPFIAAALQLAIYAFVFSVILTAKWQQLGITAPEQELPFWLIMFAGMNVYFFVNEMIAVAPGMITSVPNYVKKIKFPLEVLPIVNLLVSAVTSCVFLVILVLAIVFVGHPHWWILLAPLVFVQAAFWCLGFSWLLGTAGVFVRDLQQAVPFLLQLLLFATPIFYPLSAVPERFRGIVQCNPLTFLVETFRNLALWGIAPHWGVFAAWTLASIAFAYGGYQVFQRLRGTFADVL